METSQTPVTPARQAIVRIAGHKVLAVCTADGTIAAGFRMICVLLDVDYMGQMRKLQVDPAFRDALILAKVEIAGKKRVAYFIIAEFIPLWLKGIHPNKVAPNARQTLAEFQRVAVQTVRAFFFFNAQAQQRSAPKQGPAQSSARPKEEQQEHGRLPSPGEPPLTGLKHLHLGVESIGAKERQQDQRLDKHDRLLKGLDEEVGVLRDQVTDLAETGPLVFAHQIELQTRLKALEHQTGEGRGVLERKLADTFGVEVVEQLAEGFWSRIVVWFSQQLGW